MLEEVYDSGCLCCTPGGELNQRLNNMMMWGRFAGKKAAYPDSRELASFGRIRNTAVVWSCFICLGFAGRFPILGPRV